MEQIYDVVAWGRVVVQAKEFYLLAPKPYHSEMSDNKVSHSVWQIEGTYKWEVASLNDVESIKNYVGIYEIMYLRSIIIFGQDALIEFFQDPQTIKVKYIIPDLDDDEVVSN